MEIESNWSELKDFHFIELALHQDNWLKRKYELQFDEELLAFMQWQGIFTNNASGRTAYGGFFFQQQGLFGKRILVRKQKQSRPLTEINIEGFSQKATMKLGGRNLKWRNYKLWKMEKGWEEDGRPVLVIQYKYRMRKKQIAKLSIIKMDFSPEEMGLIVLSSIYMFINQMRNNG